ncbi:bifunctional DnaQ family exonuclease/ATP-dependent helicase [Streptococcus mitis]|uniref:3'-5' exonuclease DinG n=2 Tax=Streptococcus mitis TaxID=28037 RepID=A0A4U1L811_STRMT|nr:bifunctional DnaQ family exonuclease/ATP-dependent helicase [Streptococcus mitis]TKD52515.1 bifunctional DnaQ family exonuclease/ATP-dependent helicase [Streptococcus mitis]
MMNSRTERYVVVDLEATSTGSKAKIIQVGIVVIENGEIVDQYGTDVNPHEPLDSHIKELTGLTDQRLAVAPEFSQVAGRIFELVKDGVFVAHNVQFDANLLAEYLFFEGYELRTPRVDTVELAQVLYPQFEKYNLGILCQELRIKLDHAHTALSDAQATAELLLFMRQKLFQLPKELLETLLNLADNLLYETYLVIEEVYQRQSLLSSHDLMEFHGLFLRKKSQSLKPRKLSKDFTKNISLLDLDERPQQVEFAEKVEQLLKEQKTAFIQAQTGLGKTYGYLLPALSMESESGILVSVPTKILQNQIMQEEGSRLKDTFHIDIHSLKGPQNYLKLDNFYKVLHRPESNRLFTRFKMQVLIWLTETETGDLDEIGQLYRYQHFIPEFVHDGKLSKKSLFISEDFWKRSQDRAKSSRLLLTNHAYLVTRLEDDPEFVNNRLVIIDEAQKMLIALENLAQESYLLDNLVTQVEKSLETEKDLIQRRLLESIGFECRYLINQFYSGLKNDKWLDSLENLRQHFSELNLPEYRDMTRFFTSDREFWLATAEKSSKDVLICSSKKGRLLLADLLPEDCRVLGVSATLEISNRVSLADLLGFTEAPLITVESLQQKQQEILLVNDFPLVTEHSPLDYAEEVTSVIHSLQAFQEPLLVLFTSKELLLAVSDLLDHPHLAQYKNGEPSQLKKRFEKGERQILLGTGSFWEGVDFSTHPCVIQVIPRLPFQNPQEPLTRKLNHELRQEGKNPFYDYQLPMAIIRLKQALGRTIRKEEQASIAVILDSRVVHKRYGKQIRQALAKERTIREVNRKQITSAVIDFLQNNKNEKSKKEKR